MVLAINGTRVSLPRGGDPSQSLAEFIRTQTRFTVRALQIENTLHGPRGPMRLL